MRIYLLGKWELVTVLAWTKRPMGGFGLQQTPTLLAITFSTISHSNGADYITTMSQIEDPENNVTLQVTIPENSEAGEMITIQCPDDNYVEFVTPENVVPGDTVHVLVGGSTESGVSGSISECSTNTSVAGNSYRGVAAVTTGVIVSALVVGPVVTGIFVVGMVVCATQASKATAPVAPAVENELEEGTFDPESAQAAQPSPVGTEPETREQKIAAALVKTADYIADKWCALDERFAISSNTLRALATVQEMDERNKISETVVTNVKAFDEKYQVTEKAGNAVTATIAKVNELDESCKISENAFIAGNSLALAGSNLVGCVGDIERRYDITTRITTALIFTMSTLSDAITVYMHRLATGSTAVTVPESAAVSVEEGRGEDLTQEVSVYAQDEELPQAVQTQPQGYAQATAVPPNEEVSVHDTEPGVPMASAPLEIPV